MIRSILFVPSHLPDYQRWLDICWHYSVARGYHITFVVGSWADVLLYVMSGRARIVVAAKRDHLPPDREPRLEVVAEACLDVREPRRLTRMSRRRI